MTPRQRKPWSKVIEESGISVRLYERAPGSLLYREVRIDGAKDRKSLGHRDRALAETQARELAKRLAEMALAGHTGRVTFGQMSALFLRERVPQLSAHRQLTVRGYLTLLEQHIQRDRAVEDLSQLDVDSYAHARRSGVIKSGRHRTPHTGVFDGTIRNELHFLLSMIAWAQAYRVGGRRLLTNNPLYGATIPRERNARRPIATEERYQQLLEVADRAEPTGRLRLVVTLARETGRRINAICKLSVRDVLLSRDQLLTALGAVGLPLEYADQWPHGAIRWSADFDKRGYESVAPISHAARRALEEYLGRYPRAGDVPLLPGRGKPDQAINKEIAGYWLTRAEKLAKLPKLARGGFHPFRRLWASERRHLPAQDVAAAGGWRSLQVMRDAYQHADGAGVFSVVQKASTQPSTAGKRARRSSGRRA
jgi:integrase